VSFPTVPRRPLLTDSSLERREPCVPARRSDQYRRLV